VELSRILPVATLCVALAIATGCGGDHAPSTPNPTRDRVVANDWAVGVPYEVFVLLRDGDRLLALKINSRSPLGSEISYSWEEIRTTDRGTAPEVRRGHGETSENNRLMTGRIAIPGLDLQWSRGSSDLGWIYWPEGRDDFSVFSRTWLRPAEIDPNSRSGRWLSRKR